MQKVRTALRPCKEDHDKGLSLKGLGFGVEALGLRVQCLRLGGLGFRVWTWGLRVEWASGLGLGFGV